jgi:hypothetical protein
MNKFVRAIKDLDLAAIKELVKKDPKWLSWSEPDGKNALHYLCGLNSAGEAKKSDAALSILKFFLKNGMDINSVRNIADKNCDFPATPLWYAYTRGRNKKLYTYLLTHGAAPENCMWAIAWYDDIEAARLFMEHGAKLDGNPGINDLFLGSFQWKKYKFAGWLLENGADANTTGTDGNNALMIAVRRKDEDAVNLLLGFGADGGRENKEGLSAEKLAELKGPKRIAKLFEK